MTANKFSHLVDAMEARFIKLGYTEYEAMKNTLEILRDTDERYDFEMEEMGTIYYGERAN